MTAKYGVKRRLAILGSALLAATSTMAAEKPNILVIWGDDIGQANVSAYTFGLNGLQNAEHRQHCKRGHDVYRLLR